MPLEDICRELYYHLRQQPPSNIALVLNGLARLDLRDVPLLDHISGTLHAPWLRSFNVQDIALLVNCYARFVHPAPNLFALCAEELRWKLPDAGPQELALVAGAYAKLQAHDMALFRHVAAQTLCLGAGDEVGPRHAANLLHAFARVDASTPVLLRRLAGRLLMPGAAGELGSVGVAHACFAAGRAATRHPTLLGEVVRPLLEVLARRLLVLGRDTGSAAPEIQHIATMGRSCLRAGAHSRRLIHALAEQLERSVRLAAGETTWKGPRSVLLDAIDAAGSLRKSLDRAASAGVPASGDSDHAAE
eukprot:gnl/TRDRNA2_/TRDRNA2_157116_c0_seq1.p1 gnl/TRDRNA2_/TRDRNA2_157116_c0~~gnl/TRDRNA2_/TRDRNA2_157116_c0_seq1.p1  ORF type:complete len:304 (+),score=42.17 gnl/TRDRNA2_/TRDRNA2_157116_c0_seq1:3-914(+)